MQITVKRDRMTLVFQTSAACTIASNMLALGGDFEFRIEMRRLTFRTENDAIDAKKQIKAFRFVEA